MQLLYLFVMNFTGTPSKLKFAPFFHTAGLGVFAGRAFKQDEIVVPSWMTLILPKNFPKSEDTSNYLFPIGAVALGYGSIANHHKSFNTQAVRIQGFDNINFHVRRGFQCANRNIVKAYSVHTTDTRTHKHFQGHKGYRGWTGNFCSVWRCGVVWK